MMPFKGLAPGSLFLAFIEALERFSYYGMRGLLVLFVTAPLAAGGLGWTAQQALPFYGYYTASVWLAPLFGGWIADRWLGSRLCVLLGGWIIAAGLGLLTLGSAAAAPAEVTITWSRALVFSGLGAVALGIGLLKGNITVLLSELYDPQDPRREEAFSLYYVAINVGVVLSALIAGTVGERMGWTLGFGVCTAVLLTGMLLFSSRYHHLPKSRRAASDMSAPADPTANRNAMYFVLVLLVFATLFFAAYEQTGGFIHLTIFNRAERQIGGFEIPATWFVSSTGVFCILIGPWLATWFAKLQARGLPFDTVGRFALGLCLGGAAFALFGAGLVSDGERLGLTWPVLFYFVLTLSELALAPAGFSMAARYAPAGSAGRFMGLWLVSIAAGSVLGGQMGAIASGWAASQAAFALAATLVAAGLLLALLRRRLLSLVNTAYN